MVIVIVENVSPSLRGELTRWMLEIKPGVFVGKLSGMVRDKLWDLVCRKARDGGAWLIHTAATEQGYAITTYGDTKYSIRDFEGLCLIQRP